MSIDIEARIAKIERSLRELKAEVKRRKKGGSSNGPCLISMDPSYLGDAVHRRKLRRRDLRGLNTARLDEILDILNASMERIEPDADLWPVLKHNRDLTLAIRAKALE